MAYNPETGQWVEELEEGETSLGAGGTTVDDAAFQAAFERMNRAAYPPRPVPMPPQSPDVRLGRLNLSGGRLDAASMAVLQALQNQPRPQGFGANFVTGLAGGLAGGRVQGMSARQQQYEAERDKAKAYNEAAERFRGQAALAAERSRGGTKDAPKKMSEAYLDTKLMTPDELAAFRKRFPHIYIPPDGIVYRGATDEKPKESDTVSMSPRAAKFWSQRSLSMGGDGIPPGMGRNPRLLTAFLENTAAEADKIGMTGFDAAKAKARYRAGANAMSDLTRTMERAKPFAALLHKNIAVLRGTMGKVKDTGIQWANKPLRAVMGQMGSVEQAQFRTALVPVAKESARLLESTTLAGVLSVEAQQELRAVLSGSYTIPQLEGVLEIIEQETNNRLEAYEEAAASQGETVGKVDKGGGVVEQAKTAAQKAREEIDRFRRGKTK